MPFKETCPVQQRIAMLREWGDAQWNAAREAIKKQNEKDKATRSA